MNPNEGISEALGYDIVTGLIGVDGRDLGEVKVPYLPSNVAIRLQPRILKQFVKLAGKSGADLDKAADEQAEVVVKLSREDILELVYDEEGIQLQFDILSAVFNQTEEELGKVYSVDALNMLYAKVVQRDFRVDDLIQSFTSRFTELFSAPQDPTKPQKES